LIYICGFIITVRQAISRLKYKNPTLIQSKSIPLSLQGKDILARARTGSGVLFSRSYVSYYYYYLIGEMLPLECVTVERENRCVCSANSPKDHHSQGG